MSAEYGAGVTSYQGSHLTSQPVNHSAIRGSCRGLISQSETSMDDSWPIRSQAELVRGSLNLARLDAGDVMIINSMCASYWTKISILSDEGISLWLALWFPNFVNESEPTMDIWQEHKTLNSIYLVNATCIILNLKLRLPSNQFSWTQLCLKLNKNLLIF